MNVAGEGAEGGVAAGVMHVGIVHGVRSIHFVAVAESREALRRQLAGYVAREAGMQLYRRDAVEVERLLELGSDAEAVRLYFERVGGRWGCEWLSQDTVVVADGAEPGVAA